MRTKTGCLVFVHSGMVACGGLLYMGIELLWRGTTHWTMGVLGGVCFVLIGLLDEWQDHPPVGRQMVQGAALVTALELLVGLVLNRWLGLGIWDYSDLPGNLWGQVCPQYSALWLILSWAAIHLENGLHRALGWLRARSQGISPGR